MSIQDDRAQIIEWLHWAESMSAAAGRDIFPARRLLNAFAALHEGRTDPLMVPAKKSNSTKPKADREVEALAVASIDALRNIGVPLPAAVEKVRAIVGPVVTIDLRKKIASGVGLKYKSHREAYEQARKRFTLGLACDGRPATSEKVILDNLALAMILTKGRLHE